MALGSTSKLHSNPQTPPSASPPSVPSYPNVPAPSVPRKKRNHPAKMNKAIMMIETKIIVQTARLLPPFIITDSDIVLFNTNISNAKLYIFVEIQTLRTKKFVHNAVVIASCRVQQIIFS